MRLDTCLLADAAATTPDGKMFIHGAGITRLTPPKLPWVHPALAVVLRFELEQGDPGSHEIALSVTSPSGENMLDQPARLVVVIGPLKGVAGEESYLQNVLQLGGMPIKEEGVYSIDVILDGTSVRTLPLAVVPRARTGTERLPN